MKNNDNKHPTTRFLFLAFVTFALLWTGCPREIAGSKLTCNEKQDRVCPDGFVCYTESGKEEGRCCKVKGNGETECDSITTSSKGPFSSDGGISKFPNSDLSDAKKATDIRSYDGGQIDTPQNSTSVTSEDASAASSGTVGPGGGVAYEYTKAVNGVGCISGGECQSGFCIEQVCCDKPCNESCFACKQSLTGKPDGTCASVGSGKKDPQNLCKDETAENQCGNDGFCDGSGNCRKIGTDHVCKSSVCDGTKFVPTSTCDGKGACKIVEATECGTAQCDRIDGCRKDCKGTTDCNLNAYCNLATEKCAMKKIDGESCKDMVECQSGFCIDGVCCKTDCKDKCKACSITLTGQASGTCQTVKAGTDPHENCTEETGCGNDGTCDGAGDCRKRGQDTICSPASCNLTDNQFHSAATCDGKGACQVPKTQDCGSILCDSKDGCPGKCNTDSECAAGAYCNNGVCTLKLTPGKPCSLAKQCASGYCVEDVCCDGKCDSLCYSCKKNLTGELDGKCSAVSVGKKDNKTRCTDERTEKKCGTDGTCNGSGACKKADKGTACADPICNSGKFTAEATCDGLGSCVAPEPTSCMEYPCTTSGCQTSCTTNKDCSGNTFCDNNKCVAKRGNGKSCEDNNQCINGHCVSGICCFDACQANPPCGNSGKCDVSGQKCQVALATVLCEQAMCSNNLFTPVRYCDGAGKCSQALQDNCGNFGCSISGCNEKCSSAKDCATAFPYCVGSVCCSLNCQNGGTCSSDGKSCKCLAGFKGTTCQTEECGGAGQKCCAGSNCSSGFYCDTNSNCQSLKSTGSKCEQGEECGSGYCADKVCCDKACTEKCKGCVKALTGKAEGVCDYVKAGSSDGSCAASETVCGQDGTCDGKGSCKVVTSGIQCKPDSCNETKSSRRLFTCDGLGDCVAKDLLCGSGNQCVSGICAPIPKKPLGQPCSTNTDCVSNSCIDCYLDHDGDAYGDLNKPAKVCASGSNCPGEYGQKDGWSNVGIDCNDNNIDASQRKRCGCWDSTMTVCGNVMSVCVLYDCYSAADYDPNFRKICTYGMGCDPP